MKFWEATRNAILKITTRNVIVVEVVNTIVENTPTTNYNILSIYRKKKQIFINEKIVHCSLNDLKEWCVKNKKSSTPVLILINSNKILYKITNNSITSETDVMNAVSNINLQEFYQEAFSFDDQHFLSLSRKTFIESQLNPLEWLGKSIVGVSLSPIPIFYTYTYFFQPNSEGIYEISIGNFFFEIKSNQILNYNSKYFDNQNNKTIVIEKEKIPTPLLISYAYGLYYLAYPLSATTIQNATIQKNKKEFQFSKIGTTLFMLHATILFIVLIVSSTIFTIYSKKHAQLHYLYESNKQNLETQKQQELQRVKQLRVLEENGLLENSKTCFYADNITRTLPENIYLSKLVIYPSKKGKFTDDMLFNTRIIQIEGNCYTSNDLNEWIQILENYTWIGDISIVEYKQTDTELSSFKLEILKKTL